jgi:hypothetical protein
MALKKKSRHSNSSERIFRITTQEGTFDLLKSGDNLHPEQYWMRESQIDAFADPEITEAIEQKRWKLVPMRDDRSDFILCDRASLGLRSYRPEPSMLPHYTIDHLPDKITA